MRDWLAKIRLLRVSSNGNGGFFDPRPDMKKTDLEETKPVFHFPPNRRNIRHYAHISSSEGMAMRSQSGAMRVVLSKCL